MPPILIVRCHQLPPKPWPLTVAGLPLWLTTEPEGQPLRSGQAAGAVPIKLNADIVLWETPGLETLKEIFGKYDKMGINISRIRWLGMRFVAIIRGKPPQGWRSHYPFKINTILVTYLFDTSEEIPSALRHKSPMTDDPDDSSYNQSLRPGVMISSGVSPDGSELHTTSGICVESPGGKKYITCASHGFPAGLKAVYHPDKSGQRVGMVTRQLRDTDVSLFEAVEGIFLFVIGGRSV